jgi:hypothetical protein
MELLALDGEAERRLLSAVASWAAARKTWLVLDMNNTNGVLAAVARAFVKVPTFVLPKRQAFMAFRQGAMAEALLARKWRLSLGDWDGF